LHRQDWFLCNRCGSYFSNEKGFHITACGHVFCRECLYGKAGRHYSIPRASLAVSLGLPSVACAVIAKAAMMSHVCCRTVTLLAMAYILAACVLVTARRHPLLLSSPARLIPLGFPHTPPAKGPTSSPHCVLCKRDVGIILITPSV
jgi:hypothetical protein